MSRTLGALAGHIAGDAHTLARMLRLDLADGSVLAFTDHDYPIGFDLGDGAATYQPDTGILPSDVALAAGFEPDDLEVTGPLGEVVTRAAVLGGRFDDAEVRYFMVNWADPTAAAALLKGRVALAQVDGGRFRFVIHSQAGLLRQSLGNVLTPYCRHDFGDSSCQYVITPLAATVTAATDERTFTVSFTGTYANDHFNKGTVAFTSGALAGTRAVEVFDFTGGAGSGSVMLWTGLAAAPAVGDTLELRIGCGKTRADCMAYANIANFGGFPDVPGSDQVLRYPNPGGA